MIRSDECFGQMIRSDDSVRRFGQKIGQMTWSNGLTSETRGDDPKYKQR